MILEKGYNHKQTSDNEQSSDFTSFAVGVADGIAALILNRPERRNCLTLEFFEELPRALALMERSGVRVLVISAEGPIFSSGIDLSVLGNSDILKNATAKEQAKLEVFIKKLQLSLSALTNCRFPVIAAVHGLCLGAALDLVAAADFVYATETTEFAIAEINVGLMADLGSLQRLPQRLPEGLVRYLAFTGDYLSAKSAKENGLVLKVFESAKENGLVEVFDGSSAQVTMMEEALATAKEIASKVPSAINATKLALNYNQGHTIKASLAECAQLQAQYMQPTEVLNELQKLIASMKRHQKLTDSMKSFR